MVFENLSWIEAKYVLKNGGVLNKNFRQHFGRHGKVKQKVRS